jgi:alcohol dehydrogenase class IV
MRFELATATRIVFGPGTVDGVGAWTRELGRRALVVTGRTPERADRVRMQLEAAQVASSVFTVAHEPELETVEAGVVRARDAGCDVVIGMGGGSALDTAKAIAALVASTGTILDYLEVIGQGRPLTRPAIPCIAIPTTAGTGSEVTRNAVLSSPGHRVKVGLRSPYLLPRLAVVDPLLTRDVPRPITASTGLDALTQLIEPYLSCRANPITDALCVEGLRRAPTALRRACADGADLQAREAMALASLMSGLALANAGLGAVHGFAGPIGGMFGAAHGAICAALLPHVMAGNLRAIDARATDHPARRRFDEVARLLTGRHDATAADGVEWLRALVEELDIPPLSAHGVTTAHVGEVVSQASRASSMKANPLELTDEELAEILRRAL